jgi:hypothetical protein
MPITRRVEGPALLRASLKLHANSGSLGFASFAFANDQLP